MSENKTYQDDKNTKSELQKIKLKWIESVRSSNANEFDAWVIIPDEADGTPAALAQAVKQIDETGLPRHHTNRLIRGFAFLSELRRRVLQMKYILDFMCKSETKSRHSAHIDMLWNDYGNMLKQMVEVRDILDYVKRSMCMEPVHFDQEAVQTVVGDIENMYSEVEHVVGELSGHFEELLE